ncbi:MAG: GFA family protein, partial [Pseudomonadota bacterium]
DVLTSYRFGSGQAEHLFCSICGVKSFYQPKSHPECWSVHYACLDDSSALSPQITPFDGRNWENAARDHGVGPQR